MEHIEKHRGSYRYILTTSNDVLCLGIIDLEGTFKNIRFYPKFDVLFFEDRTTLYRLVINDINGITHIELLTIDVFTGSELSIKLHKRNIKLEDFDGSILVDSKQILYEKFILLVKSYLKYF